MADLITADAAAKKLGWSRYGLYKAVAKFGIPHLRFGDLLRFDPDDLDSWIEMQKRRTHTCPQCGQSTRRLRRVS